MDHGEPLLDRAAASARIRNLGRHPAARALADAAAGVRALLVGGATRDAALARPLGDLDAIVARDGEIVAERLAAALGGRAIALAPGRFAALRVAAPELEVDIWDLEGGAVADDLARRDLTVNAIALDLATGEILDPYDGLGDLARRILRSTSPTVFAEDPLRVLRLARLSVALGAFTIDAETAAAARRAARGLAAVAGERIREELRLLVAASAPASEQLALERVGAFPGLWDDFGPAPADSALEVFRTYGKARESAGPPSDTAAELAARHALRLRAARSDRPAAERLATFARKAIVARVEARRIAHLLALAAGAPLAGDALALGLARLGASWPEALAVAAATAPAASLAGWLQCLDSARRLVAERGDTILDPRPLLSGDEVGDLLGVAEGPRIGRALARLVDAQVLGRVSSREEARRYLSEESAREEGAERR